MNLEDYAYNQDDRWYIDPQVSLEEQNAFINNLRNSQAQDNAQIEQQTYGLGTQVPSQLGGLSGAGGYFKSRYQTPQTNQTIADLKSVMQAQAINDSLQNEYKKYKKIYQDAQNAHTANSGNNGNGNNGGGNNPSVKEKDDGSGDKLSYKYEKTDMYEGPEKWKTTEEGREGVTHSLDSTTLYRQEGESGQQWEKRLRDMGYSQNEARNIMFEINKRKRVSESMDDYKERLKSMGIDDQEINALVNDTQNKLLEEVK